MLILQMLATVIIVPFMCRFSGFILLPQGGSNVAFSLFLATDLEPFKIRAAKHV